MTEQSEFMRALDEERRTTEVARELANNLAASITNIYREEPSSSRRRIILARTLESLAQGDPRRFIQDMYAALDAFERRQEILEDVERSERRAFGEDKS